jgi:hypothetical protein
MTECDKYKQQVNKAKETVGELEEKLYQVRLKLQNNPTSAIYLQEIKDITLDMTITLNELEHSQSAWEKCVATVNNTRSA